MAGALGQALPDAVQCLLRVAGARCEGGMQLQHRRIVRSGPPQRGTGRDRRVEVSAIHVRQGDTKVLLKQGVEVVGSSWVARGLSDWSHRSETT